MNQLVEFEDQASVILEHDDIAKPDYDSDSDVSCTSRLRVEKFDTEQLKVQRLEEGSNEYEIVGKGFIIGGKKDLEKKIIKIAGIYKKKYDWSVMDEARLAVFKVFAAAVAGCNGGDANVKYGWYGGSFDEIKEIIMFGFRRFDNRGLFSGRAVCLSSANTPMESVRTSVADSDGLMHMLLCRVILGRPEVLHFGSVRDQPSSMNFDSGVDDLSSPTKYIIWEHHMNTHILPVYIISFRIDSLTGASSLRIPPTPPRMSINGLMGRLSNHLSSSKMAVIKKLQHEYQKDKISRSGFIRNLRAIAGDDVLRVLVKSS